MFTTLRTVFLSQSYTARRGFNTFASPLLFRQTPILFGEPLKKKKKIDPAILKMRDDRRRRKLQKEIRKLEKVARKYKPIEEIEVPPKLLDEKKFRTRKLPNLSENEIDYRSGLFKEWTRYKSQQYKVELLMIDRMLTSQMKALEELKLVSEDLYQAALEPDATTIPFTAKGPVNTPSISNYTIIDGEYKDITRKWNEIP